MDTVYYQEMDALRQELLRLQQENRWLSDQYHRLRKQELVSHLLRGKFLDSESILRDLRAFDICLNQDDYMLLGIKVLTSPEPMFNQETGEDQMYFDLFVRKLETILMDTISPFYECNVAHIDSGAICLIGLERASGMPQLPESGKFHIHPPGENIINRVNKLALELYDKLRTELGLKVFVAVSRPSNGIEGIPSAYADVRQILDYKQMMNVDVPVLCYHDFELEENSHASDYSSLQLEKDYLRQVELGDYAKARDIMHRILKQDFVQSLPSLHTVKVKTSAKFHSLLITLDRFSSNRNPVIYEEILAYLRQIEEDTLTTDQLELLVDQVFDSIDQYVQNMSSDPRPKWLTEMLSFIESHYRESDLNVSSISNRFQMTPSYLSKETKRFTGSTLFDYIQKLRLEYAQILLAAGSTTHSAAEDSGFGDVRSMRRAFQKYLGTTPRQYTSSSNQDNYFDPVNPGSKPEPKT